jgi:uncharacterized integral membrane protein
MVRYLRLLILLPIGLAIIGLALLNRAAVKLTYWPDQFGGELAFTAPLFAALIAALMVGVVIGSFVTWLTQGSHRRAERQYRREAERLKTEAERLKSMEPKDLQSNTLFSATSELGQPALKIR